MTEKRKTKTEDMEGKTGVYHQTTPVANVGCIVYEDTAEFRKFLRESRESKKGLSVPEVPEKNLKYPDTEDKPDTQENRKDISHTASSQAVGCLGGFMDVA